MSSHQTSWPKITIVTAVYNGEACLEDTISSVIQQGYPNFEYIIVNDGSTDGTANVIGRYEPRLARSITQPNRGLYPALNAGFECSTGEIMGWLNAGDRLHHKGLFVVGSVFAAFPEVEWITGRPTAYNQSGMPAFVGDLRRWSRYRFLAGANKHIQQESTFWRRSLWQKAGGALSTVYRAEGDFEQWVRFFRHARLYPVDALIGAYSFHDDALSHGNIDLYNQHCDEIVTRELNATPGGNWVKLFRGIAATARRIPKVRGLWQRVFVDGLYKWAGPDSPPVVRYALRDRRWVFSNK